MRSRHRHLKPKSIGALIALDSRYIDQSNNTAISQWNDISGSGNNATQGVAAKKPTLQTAQLGGNGIVRFDGSDDFLESTTITKSQPYTVFVISQPKKYNTSYNSFFEDTSLGCAPFIGPQAGISKYGMYAGTDLFFQNSILNQWFLGSYVFNTTNSLITINGAGKVTGNSGANNLNGKFQLGRNWDFSSYFNNDTAFAMTCEGAFSDSLRKRCEHSAAFSFKLPCS